MKLPVPFNLWRHTPGSGRSSYAIIQRHRRVHRGYVSKSTNLRQLFSAKFVRHGLVVVGNNGHELSLDDKIGTNQQNIQTKSFTSFSNRIWDIIQSGSFNPSNPIIDDIVVNDNTNQSQENSLLDFTKYQPHHFTEASMQLQAKYEIDLTQIEKEIEQNDIGADELIDKIEHISRPIITLQNIITLLHYVKSKNGNDERLNQGLHDASKIIQLKHETSTIIHEALKSNCDISNLSKEKVKCIQHLLRQQRLNGCTLQLDDDNKDKSVTLKEVSDRISSLESKLLSLISYTMEQHGKVTPTQQLLPYLYEIISLKQYKSQLLGYDNYMCYSLDYHACMVKSTDEISKFHDLFVEERAIELFGNDEFLSRHYDLLSDAFIDSENLKDYFELNHVLHKLFNLTSTLFDVYIEEEMDSNLVRGWDNDVRLFHLYEGNNHGKNDHYGEKKHIASFYLDAYRRLNKESGEFVIPVIYKSSTRNVPIVAMSLDVRQPVWDDSPIKLDFNDVIHLFHEFGHVLQNLLVQVELGAFVGAHTIEEDASELVSQVCLVMS
jgi:Zn-dependent oligopeptidase